MFLVAERMQSLSGEIAWVSGASGGIGAAAAIALARAGADVAVSYRFNRDKARDVAKTCRQYGVRAQPVFLDATKREMVEEAHGQVVRDLGSPSILVHAAGKALYGLFTDMHEQQLDEMLDSHVRSSFHLIQVVLPEMIRKGFGRIVLVSSVWGETGGAMEVLYSTAKAAQIGLVKSLGKELARTGVTVNAVAPGAISTPMLEAQLAPDERVELVEEIPMGRIGRPEEVAAAILFLCSREASYVTGQVLGVNGGWHA
jgi:3-oxoacyl-[acyl-carrier protein] reductase